MTRFYRIDFKGTPRHVVEEQGEWRLIEGDLFGPYTKGDAVRDGEHRLLAPIIPSKIVAIGLNYKDHAAEQGADTHREMTRENHFCRHLAGRSERGPALARGDKQNENDAHCLLSVVAAVAEAVEGSGEELPFAEQ